MDIYRFKLEGVLGGVLKLPRWFYYPPSRLNYFGTHLWKIRVSRVSSLRGLWNLAWVLTYPHAYTCYFESVVSLTSNKHLHLVLNPNWVKLVSILKSQMSIFQWNKSYSKICFDSRDIGKRFRKCHFFNINFEAILSTSEL